MRFCAAGIVLDGPNGEDMTSHRRRSKRWQSIVVAGGKAGVTGGILWVVSANVDFHLILERSESVRPSWILLGLGFFLIQAVLNAERWRGLVRNSGAFLGFFDAVRIYLEGLFFNQALPTSVGGDIVRAYRVTRLQHPVQQAINGVLLDRLCGIASLLLVILTAQPAFWALVPDGRARIGYLSLPLGGLIIIVVFLFLHRFPFWRRVGLLLKGIKDFTHLAWRLALTPSASVPALTLGFLGHCAVVSGAWALARSIGMDVGWMECFVVVPAALLFTMVPVSIAGWGVREGAMTAGFALIGADATGGLAVSVMIGLTLLVVGLIGGTFWLAWRSGSTMPDTPQESE